MSQTPRVLIIAGSDPSGGAGIQADIKTVTMNGAYAACAITALTVQNTQGVTAIHAPDPGFVADQIRAVLEDIGADIVKTGMIGDAAMIDAVCDVLEEYRARATLPVVVDPVMMAKGGQALLPPAAMATLKRRLLLLADVLTPNVPEAEALTGLRIKDFDDLEHAGQMLLTVGAKAVVMKGGHLDTDPVQDLLITQTGHQIFTSRWVETRHTHGTGCTLASAIAAGMARGLTLHRAVEAAVAYVQRAIETAPGLGAGNGPINHLHPLGLAQPRPHGS